MTLITRHRGDTERERWDRANEVCEELVLRALGSPLFRVYVDGKTWTVRQTWLELFPARVVRTEMRLRRIG